MSLPLWYHIIRYFWTFRKGEIFSNVICTPYGLDCLKLGLNRGCFMCKCVINEVESSLWNFGQAWLCYLFTYVLRVAEHDLVNHVHMPNFSWITHLVILLNHSQKFVDFFTLTFYLKKKKKILWPTFLTFLMQWSIIC